MTTTETLKPEGNLKYKISAMYHAQDDAGKTIILKKYLDLSGRSIASFYRYMKIVKGSAQSIPMDVAVVFANIFNIRTEDLVNK